MIQRIQLEQAGATTVVHEIWDLHQNAVSYDQAHYKSETADGFFSDAAEQIAERVDRVSARDDESSLIRI